MNNEWFECKVKYEKTMENGLQKKVNEPYLVDALNFTEAERRIIEEITPFMTGPFEVSDIKRARYAELFEAPGDDTADRFFRAKLVFITLDEKKGIEKRTGCYMYVQASDFAKALQNLMDGMKGTMSDFEVASIAETVILDVFKEDLSGAKAE